MVGNEVRIDFIRQLMAIFDLHHAIETRLASEDDVQELHRSNHGSIIAKGAI